MRNLQQRKLSETGLSRRNEMLKELKLSVVENHNRKKQRRTGAVVVILLTATSLVGWQFVRPPIDDNIVSDNRRSIGVSSSDQVKVPSIDSAVDEGHQNDKPKLLDFGLVSEDEILELLNDVGQPSALAEINSEWVAIPLSKNPLNQ